MGNGYRKHILNPVISSCLDIEESVFFINGGNKMAAKSGTGHFYDGSISEYLQE